MNNPYLEKELSCYLDHLGEERLGFISRMN